MLNRENSLFVKLFVTFTQNGQEIPYEDSMEQTLLDNHDYKYFIQNWETLCKRKRAEDPENYLDWVYGLTPENLQEQISEVYYRNLPTKPIVIAWGNEIKLANQIREIFDTFLEEMSPYCSPKAQTEITAYYEIDHSGFTASVYSFNAKDVVYKKQVYDVFSKMRKQVTAVIKEFNETQGINDGTNALLLKEPSVSSSFGSASKNKSDYSRGHIVDNDTAFESTLSVDEFHLYRQGKGGFVTEKECSDFFRGIHKHSAYKGKNPF